MMGTKVKWITLGIQWYTVKSMVKESTALSDGCKLVVYSLCKRGLTSRRMHAVCRMEESQYQHSFIVVTLLHS